MNELRVALIHSPVDGGATSAVAEILAWGSARGVEARLFTPSGRCDEERILREIEDWQPDLVHLHCFYHNLAYGFLSQASSRWPAVFTLHDVFPVNQYGAECWECYRNSWCFACPALAPVRRLRPNYRIIERRSKARVHRSASMALLCPSRWMKKRIARTELAAHPLEVVPYSLDTEWFRPAEQAGSGRERIAVLFSGHMYSDRDHRKGLPDLLAAWPLVRGAMPGAVLQVAGRLRGDVEAQEGVEYLGELSRLEMLGILQQASVFCLPSRGDNSPLAVLEAMSCGVPVVATRVGGIPEQVESPLVTRGRPLAAGGVLADPGDPAGLAKTLLRFLQDGDARGACAAAARDRVLAGWSRQRSSELHRAAYERALSRRSGASGG